MSKWVVLLFVGLAGCMAIPPAKPVPEIGFEVSGYHVWWLGDQWDEADLDMLSRLFIFEVQVDVHGGVAEDYGWPRRWYSLMEAADDRKVQIYPTLTLQNEAIFDTLFTSPTAIDALLDSSLELLDEKRVDGIHIDIEVFHEVDRTARAGFTSYIRRLKAHLLRDYDEAELIVFLPAFDPMDNFDEAAINEIADLLVVQGYDLHWMDGASAGPVAPIRGWRGQNWESIVQRYSQMGIEPSRILMGVPYYGYEWPTASDSLGAPTKGRGFTIPYANAYLPEGEGAGKAVIELAEENAFLRDTLSGSPFYSAYRDGAWRQGWFEDEISLRLKYQFVREEGLAGVALFALGYDRGLLRPALWKAE